MQRRNRLVKCASINIASGIFRKDSRIFRQNLSKRFQNLSNASAAANYVTFWLFLRRKPAAAVKSSFCSILELHMKDIRIVVFFCFFGRTFVWYIK